MTDQSGDQFQVPPADMLGRPQQQGMHQQPSGPPQQPSGPPPQQPYHPPPQQQAWPQQAAWPQQQPAQYQQQQPSWQPPPGWQPAPMARPRKKRRVFLWVFLTIQALFIVWLVVRLATVHTGATQAQLTSACYHHHWWPVYRSQATCVTHFDALMNDTSNTGKALGAGLIVLFWVIVDIILGISYGVYRLATRGR
ncbi:MAG TPA: hypothetical protein VGH27_35630 [Streptosporangiaceae bacterium]|jgi:hypothetical protein